MSDEVLDLANELASAMTAGSDPKAADLRRRDVIDVLASISPDELNHIRSRNQEALEKAKRDLALLELADRQIAAALNAQRSPLSPEQQEGQ